MSEVLVEGDLDVSVLRPALVHMLGASPNVTRGGSKAALPPKAIERREEKAVAACYLRDRDFDFDPPDDRSRPTEDRGYQGKVGPRVLGWRWARLNVECYLLDPALVEAATGLPAQDFAAHLQAAAAKIRSYSAARWTIGLIRAALPPTSELATRPDKIKNKDYRVPADLSDAACLRWVQERSDDFGRQVADAQASLTTCWNDRCRRLAALATADELLYWHCGRDLATALDGSVYSDLRARGFRVSNPAELVRGLGLWVHDHPREALAHLAEWRNFAAMLGAL